MKIKRIVIIGVILFLMIVSCFSMIANAETYEKENVIINPYDVESEWLLWISKDREIIFNVTSNLPINIYIMTTDAYNDIGFIPTYEEEDFNINLLERKSVKESSFSWTKPDDQSYYLVIFNPNNISATISYSYTETLFEELGESFTNLFEGICVGTLCFVAIIFYVIISLVIGIWLYKDAERRGKNGVVWFIIGFILSIIGLIIWLIVRPSISEKPTTKTSDRRCPSCGRIIPEDARACPYCAKKFEEF